VTDHNGIELRRWSPEKFGAALDDSGRPLGAVAAEIAVASKSSAGPSNLRAWRTNTRPGCDAFLAILHVLDLDWRDVTEPAR